jgi:hypothetical protein
MPTPTAITFKVTVGWNDFLVDITSLEQLDFLRSLRPVAHVYTDNQYYYYPDPDRYGVHNIQVMTDTLVASRDDIPRPEPEEDPAIEEAA